MLFRASATSQPIEATTNELRARIRAGLVAPTALVRDPLLTHDEWWTVDNLRLFHNNSCIDYAPGVHLVREVAARMALKASWARSGEWFARYRDGDAIERALGLKSLASVADAPGILGASRLFIQPSFSPETVSTFSFRSKDIQIQVAQARGFVWHRRSDDFVGVTLHTGRLELQEAPAVLRSWKRFVTVARSAPDCAPPVVDGAMLTDGIGYRHKVRSPGDANDLADVHWSSPSNAEHPQQTALLEAYRTCLLDAELGPVLPEEFRGS